jgi:nucleoside-diphosphate-sugar epimerase
MARGDQLLERVLPRFPSLSSLSRPNEAIGRASLVTLHSLGYEFQSNKTNNAHMKYLILGSSGQIGSHLTSYLRKRGDNVVEHDLQNSPGQDLRRRSPVLPQRMTEVDFVIFLAFDVGGARYLRTYQHTYDFVSNNVKIMDNVFDALRESKKPFIFASSQMSNMSYSSYGVLKALGEYYTRCLQGLIVKMWNVYGVEHDPEKWHAISDFIREAQLNKRIEMMTDGMEMRQLLYAEDCCKAFRLLAQPQTYASMSRDAKLHITSFEWVRIIDVARLVGELMNVPVVPGQTVDTVQKDLRNEPDRFLLQYWKPETSLRNGIP